MAVVLNYSMANDDHIALLKKGVAPWNAWREENDDIRPDLSYASLTEVNLCRADLALANLIRVDLSTADLLCLSGESGPYGR